MIVTLFVVYTMSRAPIVHSVFSAQFPMQSMSACENAARSLIDPKNYAPWNNNVPFVIKRQCISSDGEFSKYIY